MSVIAEIVLSGEQLMLARTIETLSDVRIEPIYHVAASDLVPSLFYAVRAENFDAFERVLEDDPTVTDATLVEAGDERRIYRVRPSSRRLLVVPRLVELGAAFLDAHSRDAGWLLRARFPDRDALVAFKGYCDEVGVGFSLNELYAADSAPGEGERVLTPAQREALVTAYERGYFEEPRRVSLDDLGEELGISSTAVSGRIRRATAKLVESQVF